LLPAVVAAAMSVALLAPRAAGAATGDWHMWGDGPAHNSVNREETTLSPSTVGSLHAVHDYTGWSPLDNEDYQVIVGNRGYSAIRVDTGGLFSDYYVASFNLSSGAPVWQRRIATSGDAWRYVPAVSNGVVYIGGSTAMYAFDRFTGAPLWRTELGGGEFNMVTVRHGTVYATTYSDEKIYAFDAATGAIRWSRATLAGCCLTGPVTIANGLPYVNDDALYVFNATTGAPVFKTANRGYFDTPAVSNGVVYLQTKNNLVARNASTGALLWSSPTIGGDNITSLTPAVDGHTVVVGTPDSLIAYNTTSGARRWAISGGEDYATPAIANGVVYSGSIENGLQAIDEASGRVLFSGSFICGNPVVANGRVYATCGFHVTAFGL
jgi:outer membrane protein assembly factor BamB